jgi:muramoyltetrapeptide carboxypeptidase
MLTPPFLKKGDIIGIAATARKISTDELNYAVKLIESKGYQVQFSTNLFAIENQFAGSDEQRKNDLQHLIDDKNVKAISIVGAG